jgi:hypothetical protein
MFAIDDLGLILGAAKMVPKVWQGIAGLFGKKTPETVLQAGKLIDEVETEISAGKVSPEQQIELKRMLLQNEQVEDQVELERLRLIYQDQAGGREVVKAGYASADPVVRQARPKMMMRLGTAGIWYTIAMPVVIGICAIAGANKEILAVVADLMWYLGLTLWGAFTTSFTGYTVARSADKRVPGMTDQESIGARLLGLASKVGHKIS